MTKSQLKRCISFLKKHEVYGLGGLPYGNNKPVIELNLHDKVWITQEVVKPKEFHCGVHRSCKGAKKIISGWCGLGWVLFGFNFVCMLRDGIKKIDPSFTEYDTLKGSKNFLKFKKKEL